MNDSTTPQPGNPEHRHPGEPEETTADGPQTTPAEAGSADSLDEPVLDGAEDHSRDDIDPRKGLADPALIRDIDAEKKTTNPYG